MADSDKAKAEAERREAVKKAAEDAEIVSESSADATPRKESGAETPPEAVTGAAEGAAPDGSPADNAARPADDASPWPADPAAEETAEPTEASDAPDTNEPATGAETDDDAVEGGDAKRDEVAEDPETEAAKADEAFVDVASETPPETPAAPPPVAAHEEHEGRTLAGVVLQWLFIFFIGATVALWVGPKIAPHLPGWASPVAEFLTPGANRAEEAVADLRAAQETAIADLAARLDGAESRLAAATEEAAAARDKLVASLEGRIAAAEEAKIDTSSFEAAVDTLAGRVTSAEAGLEGLRAEIGSLSGFGDDADAPSAETLERVAAFGASVEGLRSEVEALSSATSRIDTLAAKADLSALAERVAALEEGEAATAGAAAEAEKIRRAANLDAALTRIDRALVAGDAFATPLGTVENLSGVAAPPALAEIAGVGAPTTEALEASFQSAARDGYAAAIEAEAGDGAASQAIAGVLGRLGGRPAYETEGDDAGAVLSRIEARLREGDAERAMVEARALPEPAAKAMAGWVAKLETAAAARAALTEYRAQLATN